MKICNLQKIPNFAPRLFYKRGAKLGIFLKNANFHLKLKINGLYILLTFNITLHCVLFSEWSFLKHFLGPFSEKSQLWDWNKIEISNNICDSKVIFKGLIFYQK